jgi:hypothetical protein
LEHFFGEHIHHGHYGENGLDKIHYSKAQENLIEKLLKWGDANSFPISKVLDVGCGIGGSSRYICMLTSSSSCSCSSFFFFTYLFTFLFDLF